MYTVPAEDEYIHQDYPRDDKTPWKENWYFNFIDEESRAWGFNHISLERHKQRARFSTVHVVDGKVYKYLNYISLTEDFTELDDGKLRLEFIEPHKKFHLTFDGPEHSLDLTFLARFDVFDYAPRRSKEPGGDKKSLSVHHYEQALNVSGTLTKGGTSRTISCFGHRDHSWGYRNEINIDSWNWVVVQFADKTINVMQVYIEGLGLISRGFISEASGNTAIRQTKIISTERNEEGIPLSSVYEMVDKSGRTWTLTSSRFSGAVLPSTEEGENVTIYENFSHYTLAETGEQGVGIDEYLDNPGK